MAPITSSTKRRRNSLVSSNDENQASEIVDAENTQSSLREDAVSYLNLPTYGPKLIPM